MDRIQRGLRASLEIDPAESAREAWFDALPTEPEARSFWLGVVIETAEAEPWWYDTLVEYARRCRASAERGAKPEAPDIFGNWCMGVAAGEIGRPRRRGRPTKHIRDRLIRMAIDAYGDPERGGEPVSRSKALGLVAEAAGLEESVVAKIWRRGQ